MSDAAREAMVQLQQQIGQSIIGQAEVVEALIIGLLSDGHLLLEGLPGTAKTRAVKALAQALSAQFGRIQFTPDLLPSDVTGTEVYREVEGKPSLVFQPGPIFNQLVLADEVNRAPAKVQAALLEAMAERTLTVGGQTHQLPPLFMVLATQNPIEQEGTYPLPEAQMDRFLMKVTVPYPEEEEERAIVRLMRDEEQPVAPPAGIVSAEQVLAARQAISQVQVSDTAERYLVALVMATRQPSNFGELASWIQIGASPRASIALDRCARVKAWLARRDYVDAEDIRAVAQGVLGHRIKLSFDALADQVRSQDVVAALLERVPVG
ncbi:AAA family ATPase [Ferrimonas marina]|uniref:MoxR-like ATPase n=1 Tax=Ferrimonas marina TaxID=299255 RepID=A0A1M5VE89_9GAMM|nr:MoxR family ATPase [Ferrimonas marina]SHH73559.1 MoxR-like ATPase [Ferrimonas marina]